MKNRCLNLSTQGVWSSYATPVFIRPCRGGGLFIFILFNMLTIIMRITNIIIINHHHHYDHQVEEEPVLKMKLPDGQSVTGLRHSVIIIIIYIFDTLFIIVILDLLILILRRLLQASRDPEETWLLLPRSGVRCFWYKFPGLKCYLLKLTSTFLTYI